MISRTTLLIAGLCCIMGCEKPKERPKSAAKAPATTPTPTPPNPTPPVSANTQGLTLSYPVPDAELGESLAEGEEKAAADILKIIDGQIKAKYASGSGKRALRDAHPKTHGCLKAEFTVDPSIEDKYAQGVFTKGNKFDAIIRFSNSSEIPTQADIEKDGRGMAFKLLNVPGKKLLEVESQALSQDFIFISHPVFFIKDPVEYVTFINKFENSDVLSQLATVKSLGVEGVKIAKDIKSLQISSPIQAQYWSNVPYQLGVGPKKMAVKYTAKPCAINGKDSIPKSTKDDNYLRTRMIEHFKNADACMDIYVQARTDNAMSVEDSRVEWKTPWSKVATLSMKKGVQDIAPTPDSSLAQNQACDTLSFNPWHSLPEHKPLGSMNRVRKSVYEHISKLRHEINKEPRKEPT
jgi:hypothetical protein